MSKKEYVVCICNREYEKILFIEKNRPAWCAGRINFPGGSIEEGESPEEAAIRELKEESGLDATHAEIIGTVECPDSLIYCVLLRPSCGIWNEIHNEIVPASGETEKVLWMAISTALRDKRILSNLKVIIPMCLNEIYGFKIIHETFSENEFKVII